MNEIEECIQQKEVLLTKVKAEPSSSCPSDNDIVQEQESLLETKYNAAESPIKAETTHSNDTSHSQIADVYQSQYVVTREIIDIKEDQGKYFYSYSSEDVPVNPVPSVSSQKLLLGENDMPSCTFANLDAVINDVLGFGETMETEDDDEEEDGSDEEDDKGSNYEPSDLDSEDAKLEPKKAKLEPKQKNKKKTSSSKSPAQPKTPPKVSTIGIDIQDCIGDMKGYTCDICNALFAIRNMFIRHCKNVHNDDRPFKCIKCKKKFGRTDHLKVHILAVHTDYYFSCDKCEKKYKHKSELKRHIRVDHLKTLSYDCDQCDEKFSHGSTLARHKTTHNDERPHICEHCGQNYKVKADLNKHIRCVHRKIRNYKCKECKRGFFSASHLARHRRTHDGSKPFTCSLCNATFIQNSNLNQHIKVVHEKRKDFVCSTCGHAFGHKHDLTRHELSHSGQTIFTCPQCGKHYAQKVTLRRHIRFVHENQRNYICVECDSRFTTKAHLDRHSAVHTDSREHVCVICDKGYKSYFDLKRHLRHIHKTSDEINDVNILDPSSSKDIEASYNNLVDSNQIITDDTSRHDSEGDITNATNEDTNTDQGIVNSNDESTNTNNEISHLANEKPGEAEMPGEPD